jgi:ferric-dicitrate binding protein FerR (iron transport regulator)
MSMEPRYAEVASELLARAIPEPPSPGAEDRLAAIRAVERAMRRKARRRLLSRGAGLVAAAASVAVYFAAQRPSRPIAVEPTPPAAVAEVVRGSAVTIRGGDEQPISASVPVTAGDRIVARPASNARVKLSTGTMLFIEEGGDLSIVEQASNQVFSLAVGAMRADVAKLAQGQRFVIRTPDAELEARGTSFRVARIGGGRLCPAGLTTKLSVFEGQVVARAHEREVSVGPGEEWTACELRASAPAPAEPPSTSSSAPADAPSARATPAARGLQPINDLFADAMDAKAKGDKARALSALQRLETLYPASPLAESAAVERMKLLASTNPKAAAVVAKRYLVRYPDGFARDVAEGIVAKSP